MGPRTAALAVSLLLAAGCRAADATGGPGPPRAEGGAAAGCPDPACAAGKARAADAGPSAADRDRAAVAAIRGSPSLALETEPGRPSRGRVDSGGQSTLVEVRAVEVAPPSEDHPGLVRFAMRLCAEDGTTNGRDLRPSRRPERRYDALPEGWTDAAVGGVPFHRYYSCEGGTAWEVDGIADVLEGGRVRFTLRAEWIACTK